MHRCEVDAPEFCTFGPAVLNRRAVPVRWGLMFEHSTEYCWASPFWLVTDLKRDNTHVGAFYLDLVDVELA